MDKETVACYCRVSTSSNDQKNSYDNQKQHFEREIGQKYNLLIYADRGITGTKLRRDEFDRMLYDAGLDRKHNDVDECEINRTRKPLFNHIFVKNTSRFARNVMVVGILRVLRQNSVFVHFLDKNITTEDDNWEFVFNLFMNFDQQESKDKSNKVKFGHYEGAKKGNIITNGKLYGYQYVQRTNSLEIIEDEAEIVRKIFSLYSGGLGIRRIISELESDGITTRDGKSFARSTISNILENEKYCGDLVRNKYDSGTVFYKSYPKLKPEKEWIIHENNEKVPAIISKELFEKCVGIKKGKSVNHRGVYRGKSKFAGIIKCGKCGSSYIRNNDRGRYFYNCSLKKAKGLQGCDNVNVNESLLEEKINKYKNGSFHFVFGMSKDTKVQQLNELKNELLKRIDQEKSSEVKQKKIALEQLYDKKNKLLDLYLEEDFSKDELDRRRNIIDIEIEKMGNEIKNLSMHNEDIYNEVVEIEEQIEAIKKLKVKETYNDKEIIENIHEIEVHKDHCGNVSLAFRFKAFDLIDRIIDKYKMQLTKYDYKYFQKKIRVKGFTFN